jgi:hypothetical protein
MSPAQKPAAKRKRGRPSKYTPELALAICARLARGESLRKICEDPNLPDDNTVRNWGITRPDFFEQYARAREKGADTIADLAIEAATLPIKGEDVPAARLAFDARRWYCGKISKRYGDKVTNEHTGPGGGPIETRQAPPPLVPREVAIAVRRLIAGAEADAGLPPGSGTDAERLRTILNSGKPLAPELYAALYETRGGRDD